jgi:hypothetical protein
VVRGDYERLGGLREDHGAWQAAGDLDEHQGHPRDAVSREVPDYRSLGPGLSQHKGLSPSLWLLASCDSKLVVGDGMVIHRNGDIYICIYIYM